MEYPEITELIKSKYALDDSPELPKICNGMGRQGLYQLFAELGYTVGAEVGAQTGRNAKVMLETIPNLKLYAIDPYTNHEFATYHWDEAFLRRARRRERRRLKGTNTVFIDKFSEDAVRDIPYDSLDFVYIDGDHSYDYVMLDIILWQRKVKVGGIISGHDYYYNNNRQSRQAKVTACVNDYTRIHALNPWYITDKSSYKDKGDGYPSWFWVKKEHILPNKPG